MALANVLSPSRATSGARHLSLTITTSKPIEFVDITAALQALVAGLGLVDGTLTVQTWHTTTGLMVNEYEPLLLDDLAAMFERLVPAGHDYAHDDPRRRTVNLTPTERRNGHAHCRAALLRASESLTVCSGVVALGRWQRVIFVDFDGGQTRRVAVTLMGNGI